MNLINTLKRHEGSVLNEKGLHVPYVDSVGVTTIAYGFNLSQGIPEHIAEQLLDYSIEIAKTDLTKVFPDLSFSQGRKEALTNLMFNIGLPRFKTFKKMIAAVNKRDWTEAAVQLLDSKYAKQVGYRAEELAEMLR